MAGDFELYKLLVEEVRETRSARRDLSNTFMTLNLGGVGALAFLADGRNGHLQPLIVWAAVALLFVCWIWSTSNSYYTKLLGAKYQVLYDVERDTSTATPIAREYELMKPNKAARHFSLEKMMPTVFALGYIVFVIYIYQPLVAGWFDMAVSWVQSKL